MRSAGLIFLIFLILILNASCRKKENTVIKEPSAEFVATPRFQQAGAVISFQNFSNNIERVEWDFGDGTTSTELSPNHKWVNNGVYNVTLKVMNGQKESRITKKIGIANKAYVNGTFTISSINSQFQNDTLNCSFSTFGSLNQVEYSFTENILPNTPSLAVRISDIIYFTDPAKTYGIKLEIRRKNTVIQSYKIEGIDIVDGPQKPGELVKLNCADFNYSVSLSYK